MEKNQTQVIQFEPFERQARVFTSTKRIIIVIAGVQGGKTTSGIYWSQLQIQNNPDKNGLICGLSHDQLNNVIIEKFFSTFPFYKKHFVKKEKTLYLPTGGKVFFRPLEDPKYVEGITASWAWIDEGDLVSYKAYLVVRGRLGSTGGRLLITSSLADGGWLGGYAEKMSEAQDIDVISWRSVDNPSFSKEEWEALKKEIDPFIFKRRYEAVFTKYSGRVYPFFDFNKHVVSSFKEGEIPEKSFVGFDWGWNDPTAIVVLTLTNFKNLYVQEDFMLEKMPLDLIVRVINEFRKKYKIVAYFADPSNKQFLQEVSRAAHINITPALNRDLFSGIAKVRNLIYQNRLYVFKDRKNILNEFRNYRYIEKVDGLEEEPETDRFNHALDALRYIVVSYPFPEKKVIEKAANVLPDFWLRRTRQYKRLLDKEKDSSYTDIYAYGYDDFFV